MGNKTRNHRSFEDINWKKNGRRFGVFAIINSTIIPVLIWCFIGSHACRLYFITVSIGLPYIIITLGSLWHYSTLESAKTSYDLALKSLNKNPRIYEQAKLFDDRNERARRNYEITKSSKEFFDRSGLLIRAIILFLGILFIINDSIDFISSGLLNMGREDLNIESDQDSDSQTRKSKDPIYNSTISLLDTLNYISSEKMENKYNKINKYYSSSENLNVRAQARVLDENVIGTILKDDVVRLIEMRKEWWYIEYDCNSSNCPIIGFVHSDYLKPLK